MLQHLEVTIKDHDFKIKYFDESTPLEYFTPYKQDQPKNFNGIIEVYYTPPPFTSEQQCKIVFDECNDELIKLIFDKIVNENSKLYSQFDIDRKFHNFEILSTEMSSKQYITRVRRELKITLKN